MRPRSASRAPRGSVTAMKKPINPPADVHRGLHLPDSSAPTRTSLRVDSLPVVVRSAPSGERAATTLRSSPAAARGIGPAARVSRKGMLNAAVTRAPCHVAVRRQRLNRPSSPRRDRCRRFCSSSRLHRRQADSASPPRWRRLRESASRWWRLRMTRRSETPRGLVAADYHRDRARAQDRRCRRGAPDGRSSDRRHAEKVSGARGPRG